MNEKYFPFGFRYPSGLAYNEQFPDPEIECIRHRMEYLNEIHALSGMPGHTFAAALALFQKESELDVGPFWDIIEATLTKEEVAVIAQSLADLVANEPPRLDFPNAIALFDCRFVATKEWEHVRRYSIGGSEVSTVLGLSHFQSRRTLYHEKRTPYKEVRSAGSQQILDYGHAIEDYIIEETAARLGAVRYPEYRMFAHRDYLFVTCNPDGILWFPPGVLALFEAKSAMWLKRSDWKPNIPDYYAPQPRQYLEVLHDPKIRKGYISVCFGGLPKDFLTHSYERDDQLNAQQLQEVVGFWNDHIAAGILPDFCGDADLDLKAEYGYEQRSTTVLGQEPMSEDNAALFVQYNDLLAKKLALDDQVKQAKKEEQEIREQIALDAPEGLTIVSVENGMSYQVKIAGSKRSTVNMKQLEQTDPQAAQRLREISDRLKEQDLPWTTPKIASVKAS